MFILVSTFVVLLKLINVCSEFSYPLEECKGFHTSYMLEDQVIDWYNSVQGHVWVNGCANKSVVEKVFDPSLIVKYGYSELFLDNTLWPTVPETAAMKSVSLKGVTPIGVWGGCSQLEKMHISSPVNLTMISRDWLANCSRVNELSFHALSIQQVRTVLDTVSNVRYLTLHSVFDIENVLVDPLFPSARGAHEYINILELSLSNSDNELRNEANWSEVSESFVRQLSLLPRLEEVRISYFDKLDWCASVNNTSFTFPSLKLLWMPGSKPSSKACFRELRVAPKLKDLGLTYNKVQFSELISSCAQQLKVDFVKSVIFQREDYLRMSNCNASKKGKVELNLENDVQCDCGQSLWLTRALIEELVTLPYVTCSDKTPLVNQTCDWLYCDRIPCDTPCVCCDDGNYGVVADCRDSFVTSVPKQVLRLTNLTELLIPNSNLSALPEEYPESLTFIDLYGNDLLHFVEASDIVELFSVPERIVRLAANPIICTCDNQLVIKELQLFQKQIEDFNLMECAGNGLKIRNVDVRGICASRDQSANLLMLVIGALVLAIITLLLGVVLYYRLQIKIFLFARGWCLCCINEEELDSNRRYDVFLSYCFEDENFVVNELLAKLDQEYAVCVHFRDWNPGGMIPSQIWTSVEQSRRTIVVLSRNFIKSLWGVLEFRSAYVSGLTEGRIRVVMVVIDDVLEKEDLQGELRAYIRLNTYLKWGDPWFWDKLRFALPHHSVLQEVERERNPSNHVNYLVSEPELVNILACNNHRDIDTDDIIDEATNHVNGGNLTEST